MRLIDADALMESAELFEVKTYARGSGRSIVHFAKAWLSNEIAKAPTIEAEPVRHGRWIMRGGTFRCSECDSKALLKLASNVGGCREYEQVRSNRCPNCGAKMDGDSSGPIKRK